MGAGGGKSLGKRTTLWGQASSVTQSEKMVPFLLSLWFSTPFVKSCWVHLILVCVLLEVEGVFHEKKKIPFCNSHFSLVGLEAKTDCVLTTKLREL